MSGGCRDRRQAAGSRLCPFYQMLCYFRVRVRWPTFYLRSAIIMLFGHSDGNYGVRACRKMQKKKFLVLAFQSRPFFSLIRVGENRKPSKGSFRDPKIGHNRDPRPNAGFGRVFNHFSLVLNKIFRPFHSYWSVGR